MIGIDILEIQRLKTMANEAFLDRVFTQSEKKYIADKNFSPQTIAGMFCGKEAVLKALGSGIGSGCGLLQVEITHNANGQPQPILHANAKTLLDQLGTRLHLSISHNNSTAVAVAVILP